MDAGAIVEAARTHAGLTQRELAERVGTSQSAIARIERGVVSPSLRTVRRLVAAAGFDLRLSLVPASPADPVVEAYKRDVDRTLLRENLRKSVEQRLADMDAFRESAQELRQAVRRGNSAGNARTRKRRRSV